MISKYGLFCTVVQMRNFTRAAEKLGYTQSSVSQTIKNLENELGVILVERKKDGVRLTDDGKIFYPYIREIYAAEQKLDERKKGIQDLENATIKIGGITSASVYLLPTLIREFQELHPHVCFKIHQSEYSGVRTWVDEGVVDLGFTNADYVGNLEMCHLYDDEIFAVLPKDHSLAKKEILSMEDFADEPFILPDEGMDSAIIQEFEKRKIPLNIKYKIYESTMILAMIRQGLGISLVYYANPKDLDTEVAVRKLDSFPHRSIAIIWKNKHTLSYAARQFAEFVIKRASRF